MSVISPETLRPINSPALSSSIISGSVNPLANRAVSSPLLNLSPQPGGVSIKLRIAATGALKGFATRNHRPPRRTSAPAKNSRKLSASMSNTARTSGYDVSNT